MDKKVLVAPSILSADFANLERDVLDIKKNGADWVHVDVMDGMFVPNITIGMPVVKALRRVTDQFLDVHLMIEKPIRYVEEFIASGADQITIHMEADAQENTIAALKMIREKGCKAAISLKPGTPAEAAAPYLALCDMILVMTVEPGYGGQSFMTPMLDKLRALRSMLDPVNPGCLLQVDGGINLSTGKQCLDAGANVLVMGSTYFKSTDRLTLVDNFHQMAANG